MPTLATTTNNGFRYPTDANAGPDFALGIADLGGDVDGMWSAGTLASRPAAAKTGRIYHGTDTGLTYWDTGAAWLTVMLAGAWTALALPGGGQIDAGALGAQARPEGDVVRLTGSLLSSVSAFTAGTTMATLPSGLRPAGTLLISAATETSGGVSAACHLSIQSSGAMSVNATLGLAQELPLDSITFPLAA